MGEDRFHHRDRGDRTLYDHDGLWRRGRPRWYVKNKTLLFLAGGIILVLIYGLLDPASGRFPKCPFLMLTGLLCPGCGSQRAIHQLLHGHIVTSFQYNQLLIPAIAYAMLGGIISTFAPKIWPEVRKTFYGSTAAYTALVIILAFAILRNIL